MLACSLLPNNIEHTDENIFKAMEKLRYPALATIKKDGIRGIRCNGTLASRTLKPIPNISIRSRSMILPGGFDIELWHPELTYDQIESIVMSKSHVDQDKIQFHVLDWYLGHDGLYSNSVYKDRCAKIAVYLFENERKDIIFDRPYECTNATDLITFFGDVEFVGHEGICFRTPNSPYKQGRSTLKEQYLVKLCRYVREEVTIIGFEEQLENANSEKKNGVGMMDRSSHASSMYGKDTLGAFQVRDSKGREYTIGNGVGLTDRLRKVIWEDMARFKGKQITIKYKPFNEKDKPRSPVFVGFREKGI